LLHAAGEHKKLVASGECCWPVRDQHNDRSARLEIDDRLVQGRLALAVEVRVRLVEEDKKGVAIQGACERDALPLSSRQHHTAFADSRVIAGRKP